MKRFASCSAFAAKVKVQADDDFEIFGPDSLSKLWGQLTGGLGRLHDRRLVGWIDGRRRRRHEHHARFRHRAYS